MRGFKRKKERQKEARWPGNGRIMVTGRCWDAV